MKSLLWLYYCGAGPAGAAAVPTAPIDRHALVARRGAALTNFDAANPLSAGWDGAPKRNAPSFPGNGQWNVRWENLRTAP